MGNGKRKKRDEKGREKERTRHVFVECAAGRFFLRLTFSTVSKKKKEKKIARKTNDCCEERIRVFFIRREEEEKKEWCAREGRGELRRSSRKILTELRVGDVEEGQKWRASSPVGGRRGRGCGFRTRESEASLRILIANILDIRTRELHACVRSRKASFLTDNAFVFIVDRHL